MAIFKVLLNEGGNVVGSMQPKSQSSGPGAPTSASLVARGGQRIVEIEADDRLMSADPAKLHDELGKHLSKSHSG